MSRYDRVGDACNLKIYPKDMSDQELYPFFRNRAVWRGNVCFILTGLLALNLHVLARAQSLPATTSAPATTQVSVDSNVPTSLPSTRPTTQPVRIDVSTPKAALMTLSAAIDIGDSRAIEAVLLGENDRDRAAIDVLGRFASAFARFRHAATFSFGADGASYVTGKLGLQNRVIARIDEATEIIREDSATVALGRDQHSPSLRRVNGEWRMHISELFQSMDDNKLDETIEQSQAIIAAMESVSKDMEILYFRTPEDVVQTFLQRMLRDPKDKQEEK